MIIILESIEHLIIHQPLLGSSLLKVLNLHLKKLNFLLLDSYLLIIFLLFSPILFLDSVQLLNASVAALLQSLVNLLLVKIQGPWS